MTRWAVLSDVHGNLPALERAIAACRARGADRFVYLGDLLGRGNSDACVELVRETASISVIGNRDLDWAGRVGPAARAYVLSLPRIAEAGDFAVVHGDARLHPAPSTADLRRGFRRSYGWLRERGKRLGFFGHSHHARVWRKSSEEAPPEALQGYVVEVPRVAGAVYFVNVGTTGLPFPGKGPPSCALYDDQARTVEHLILERAPG